MNPFKKWTGNSSDSVRTETTQKAQTSSNAGGYQSPLDRGLLVLNESQYEHFESCMTKPEKPSKMMVNAAADIQKFVQKRR